MQSWPATKFESRVMLKEIHLKQFFISVIFILLSSGALVSSLYKCCASGRVFDHNLRCTNDPRPTVLEHSGFMRYGSENLPCNGDPRFTPSTHLWNKNFSKTSLWRSIYCLEYALNGSRMIQICSPVINENEKCDGILTKVTYWGADIAMHMNIVHVVFCLMVVILYMIFSDLGRKTYNRAVVLHNACLLSMGCTLSILGVFTLCHLDLNSVVVVLLWLILQFFTLASAFWLNVICFDMTLVITQFRWMFGSFDNSIREQNRRFRFYGIFAWGGALIPTLFAGIMEILPVELVSHVLRPDYTKYRDKGHNLTVNMYFFFLPLVTLFFNNILFVYTSYKIFIIKRSTAMVNNNEANALWKKYFLFLRLYLSMGAPWFFGMLMALLNQLWILKACRIVQPILWLLMLISRKKVRRRIADKLGFSKSDRNPSCEHCPELKC